MKKSTDVESFTKLQKEEKLGQATKQLRRKKESYEKR